MSVDGDTEVTEAGKGVHSSTLCVRSCTRVLLLPQIGPAYAWAGDASLEDSTS